MRTILALVALVPFTIFSVWMVAQHGYLGFLDLALRDGVAVQVFLDLGLSLGMLFVFMRRDAERHGVALWPWLLIALGFGSIGPLGYLVYTGIRGPKGTGSK